MSADVLAAARAWLADDPDETTAHELAAILELAEAPAPLSGEAPDCDRRLAA